MTRDLSRDLRIQTLGGAHNELVAYFREHPNE